MRKFIINLLLIIIAITINSFASFIVLNAVEDAKYWREVEQWEVDNIWDKNGYLLEHDKFGNEVQSN